MNEFVADLIANPGVVLGLKVGVLLLILPIMLVFVYIELKVSAHMQHRLGPMYPGGFHGWAQPLADGIKFIQKEEPIPRAADKWVFSLVPYITMLGAVLTFVVIPVGPRIVIEDLSVGLFFALAASSVGVIGILMAGWASANKYSLIGALRMGAQLISYELPLVLVAAAVALQAGSMSLVDIVEAQRPLPFAIWVQPLGFAIFMVAATAEIARTPFDMPVAEAEIITGAFTEYSGMRFIFSFFAAEFISLMALSALAATIFLGGYLPVVPALDFIPGFIWFFLKMSALIMLLIWARWTFPRLREDQLQKFAWKALVPLALLNIFLTAALKLTPLA